MSEIIDGDGHVTETGEQIAKHLDEPYRKRPLLSPFFPQDAWDRRLIGTKGQWAGDAKSWVEALDAGGMSTAVLFPTLGLFNAFLHDAEWAVVLCRAYNTMLYKELTSVSPRLKGVALLPISMDAFTGPYFQHQLVRIYMLVGEPEKALDQLEPLLAIPYYLSPGWLRIDPTFDSIRENPRFKKLSS